MERTVGHYKLLDQIGQGGMGQVWKAWDPLLNRLVAIKSLAAGKLEDSDARRRFVLEAQAASALNHPNIVAIYDIGNDEGSDYIVMEFVAGKALDHAIAAGPVPVKQALRYALQITDALARAHAAGIIHRDLKPSNLMITDDGVVKLLDFGLAKVAGLQASGGPATSMETLTKEGTIAGTVSYMSPEQAQGKPLDVRSDVFSLGVVLYEMFSGRRPFAGDSQMETLMAIVRDPQPSLAERRADLPPEVVRIVNRCLEKDRGKRPSAADVHAELAQLEQSLTSGRLTLPQMLQRAKRPSILVPALAVLLGLLLLVSWMARRASRVRWASQDGLAAITELVQQGKYTAAFDLAKEVEKLIPTDGRLKALWPDIVRTVWVETDPSGVEIYRREYNEPETAWRLVGKSPAQLTVPRGYYRWKFVKEGFETTLALAPSGLEKQFFRLSPKQPGPEGMVQIPEAQPLMSMPVGRLGTLLLAGIPAFWMDRYEVSNRQFKEFVDRGGYRNQEYWKQPFRKGTRTLSWEDAVHEFVDATGRPGPATWEAGTYPAGEDDFPVRGVSWYEAAAYAEFAGKQLPTIYHWYRAADPRTATYVVPQSNFQGTGPAKVGQFQGIGPFGTYDMAGNVKEWCFNETDHGFRFALGGGWRDAIYMFVQPDAKSPFDRDAQTGFRCVRYNVQPAEAQLGPRPQAEFPAPTPVSDEVFRSYRALFSYDPKEPNARTVEVDRGNPDWTREHVTFEAADSAEQVPGYLFLPKNAKPPFQVVVYHPSASALQMTNAQSLDGPPRWDFLVRTGRAVFHPVLPNTYGRTKPQPRTPVAALAALVERGQDIRRAVDYLESRPDIDRTRIAYLGASWGAGSAPVFLAVEPRFKVAVLQDGGFFVTPALPEMNGVNYAPRVRIPVLMINGRYDYFFPLEASQTPLFNLLGTPAADKRHTILEASHDVSPLRQILMRETLDWLDKYLGPVQR